MSAEQVKPEPKVETNGQASNQQQGNRQNDGHNNSFQRRGGGFGGRGGGFGGRDGGKVFPNRKFENSKMEHSGNEENRNNRGGFGGGRGGGRRGGPGGAGGHRDREGNSRGDGGAFINERLLKQISGPTLDLPPQEIKEKVFNGRCRLYVGNLPPETSEEDLQKLFQTYGQTSEIYVNKEKNFSFIRLDYRSSAEKAKRELDGSMFKNRNIKVRFAPLGAAVKVKNLTNHVTNELLETAFSVFGEVERAIVFVDERGNSLKEGLVEFTRKIGATSALRFCAEGCFFLTSVLKPVICEPYEIVDDSDGFSEKSIIKKGPDFFEARETGPRFAKQGSFEFEFGIRWKQIHELYKQKEDALKREMKLEEEKLEAQMQYARYEQETEMLREQLRQREMDRERQKREWEMKERLAEEQRLAEEEALRRQQEDMSRRMSHQEDELRRRHQENSLFMQGQQNDKPESPIGRGGNYENDKGGFGGNNGRDGGMPNRFQRGMRQSEANFMDMGFNRGGNRYDGRPEGMMVDDIATRRPQPGGGPPGRWGHPERRPQQDDFPVKRRRY